ncbi:Uu.00g076880.m01.CDS01 [Anthostomella pinea]|uniref:Uu.00g076880.m01.CDS01 n=1 Tax=Anthostomella pinea TaxID=933095 RepID=A0AAI8YP88_9PEZI|nr:Uu.00g076880.m01.CDS01 [Anthostomella pinea]
MSDIDKRPGTFSPWWFNRITTLDELDECLRSDQFSFVALDTEFIAMNHRTSAEVLQSVTTKPFEPCTEVGLSFLLTLHPSQHAHTQAPECTDLDTYVDGVVEGFKREAGGRPLMVVGFSLFNDLRRMYGEFPRAGRHFAACVDLDKVLQNARSSRTPGMGLGTSLAKLGYPYSECADQWGLPRWNGKHCAGIDAVRVFALLEGLKSMDDKLEGSLRLNPSRTKDRSGPLLRIWECAADHLTRRYTAKVVAVGGGGLPPSIDSIFKLSCYVQAAGHDPFIVAGYGNTYDRGIHSFGKRTTLTRREGGWVIFDNEAGLDKFVSDMNGKAVDAERLEVMSLLDPVKRHAFAEEQMEKKLRREQKRNCTLARAQAQAQGPASEEDDGPMYLDSLVDE